MCDTIHGLEGLPEVSALAHADGRERWVANLSPRLWASFAEIVVTLDGYQICGWMEERGGLRVRVG